MTNLELYFKDANKLGLQQLTKEEELELGRQIQNGTPAEAKRARDILIMSNTRLVVKIAKSYSNARLSMEDLIAEGNSGLIVAANKYDPELGNRFSTAAVPWIRQAINKAIADKGRQIRLPNHIYLKLGALKRAKNEFAILGIKPTNKQLAEKLKVSEDEIERLKEYKNDSMSLDTPVGDDADGETTIGDLQADGKVETPDTYVEHNLLRERELEALHRLPDRTCKIVKLIFGIREDGDSEEYSREHTLEEVGKIVGLTRERVRQIKEEGLSKMRNTFGDY